MLSDQIIDDAKQVIAQESKAIQKLDQTINDAFVQAVLKIHDSKARVVITGIGKSGIIAQKIVATLNSTGTKSIYMHAADAIHGDLGIIEDRDIVICISKSGNTPEIKVLVPLIKNFGNLLIGITSNADSFLANQSDYTLNCFVDKEACPNNLAPTTSTTAQLVMGDAIAICLLKLKGFSSKDFARFHPGGALGKQLYLRVKDLIVHNEKPLVYSDTSIDQVIIEMTQKRLGVTAVVDRQENLLGIITDGDLRRMLNSEDYLSQRDYLKAKDIMSIDPRTIQSSQMAVDVVKIIKINSITQVLVVDNQGSYVGVLHIHDLIREGIL